MHVRTKSALILLLWLAASDHVVGQVTGLPPVTADDPAARAEAAVLQFGPLAITPVVTLGNLGVDTNVFNEPESREPKSDFTFTLSPRADVWMRLGRSHVTFSLIEDVVFYSSYPSQRGGSHRYAAAWRMPWNRLVIVPNASYGNLFERPGFEIDTRARRYEMSGGGLVAYRLTGKTTVQARYDSTTVDFDEDASFRGDSLSILLDRRMSTGGLEFRHRVTPLTTLGVDVHRQEDRFEYATYRDSDSTRVVGTIDLDPFALIKGSARLGYRNFTPLDANVPGFSGLVGALNLSYVARQSTRLSIQALRDVQYSYEVERPYYVQTGVSGSLTQHLVGPFQAAFRVGHHRLAYRALTVPATVASEEDPDTVRAFGASIGYRLGRNSTISFDADHQQRFSVRESQEYKGFRMGVSVTYAF